jgi:hypothetical protein
MIGSVLVTRAEWSRRIGRGRPSRSGCLSSAPEVDAGFTSSEIHSDGITRSSSSGLISVLLSSDEIAALFSFWASSGSSATTDGTDGAGTEGVCKFRTSLRKAWISSHIAARKSSRVISLS